MWGVSAQKGRSRLRAGRGGKGAEAWAHRGGGRGQGQLLRDSAMDSDFGTVKFSPCACCITRPPLFLAGGGREIRRERIQPPGLGVTCWPKPGGGKWWSQALPK